MKKPRASVLASPWVSFRTDAASYADNFYLDTLDVSSLSKMVRDLKGKNGADRNEWWSYYTEFTHPVGKERKWADLLPEKTYVSAGSNELLMSDITAFAESVKKEFGQTKGSGRKFEFEFLEGGVHNSWCVKVYSGDAGLKKHTDAKFGEALEEAADTEYVSKAILNMLE